MTAGRFHRRNIDHPAPDCLECSATYVAASSIGDNFSNIAMQQDSPFMVPWWYRKEFMVPESYRGKSIWLEFGGINYRANIWLNGKQIAKKEDAAGAWRTYEFDITKTALPGQQ